MMGIMGIMGVIEKNTLYPIILIILIILIIPIIPLFFPNNNRFHYPKITRQTAFTTTPRDSCYNLSRL